MTTTANRPHRKASDEDLIRLNTVGLPLRAIGSRLNCHHSTVSGRLEGLGIKPADTRRSFMEDIFNSLPSDVQDWLPDQIKDSQTVRDYVQGLILEQYTRQHHNQGAAA